MAVLSTKTGSSCGDGLYGGFRDPPAQARPFVRWWWNGDCVTKKEILRELDVMKAAGVGGVEINPIAMPEWAPPVRSPALKWLSPRWNKMVRAAADGARQRGMLADLIVGSGWPFGGKFLKPGEMIQSIAASEKALTGPAEFVSPLSDIQTLPRMRCPVDAASAPRLAYLCLMPSGAVSISETIDLTGAVGADGTVRFDVPPGKHMLYVGTWREGYTGVVHGAPGADGQVLDHINAAAVGRYLSRMSEAMGAAMGGKMGDGLRAMFCDSLELSGANWTGDFAAEFRRRRGYELDPYLHLALYDANKGYDEAPPVAPELADTIRRVRHDYNQTLVELFHDRFIGTFSQWCHANGMLSRYQAYGGPALMGMLGGYMLPDIPEGDTWLYHAEHNVGRALDGIRYAVWNKYAASGGHLTGRRLVGCEAMTNLAGVFRTTLEYIKQAGDLNLITGVTHSILHGFNYSPPEAAFPGLIRYGTYFSERNPWWPYFKLWADYNARLSWVLQASQPASQIAILGPTGDVWSRSGLWRTAFIRTPEYLHEIWQMLHASGYSCDYVDGNVLAKAKMSEGRLRYGPMDYEMLIVADVESLEPAAAEAILRFARAGGRVAFLGRLPNRSPGLKGAPANDDAVRAAISAAIKAGGRRVRKPAPRAKAALLAWARSIPKRLGVRPDVEIAPPHERLFQVHHRLDGREVFFFSNQRRAGGVDFRATFNTGGRTPWRWDAETGRRSPMPHGPGKNVLDIHLDPLESLLVVFEPSPAEQPAPVAPAPAPRRATRITGPWSLTLTPTVGETFHRTKRKLADLSGDRDPALRTFGGTVVYRTEFDLPRPPRRFLDLGKVCGAAEVTLNGRPVGVRWWGRRLLDAGEALKSGRNVLEVKVATVLVNYCRSLKDNATAARWTRTRIQAPAPTGLIGPVRLLAARQDKPTDR